ncbi:MBL fold metallo-hydrolase [Heliobacillus mobilis]|uniref:MBL fold metallo-hydrolase n=1 Tax=Heliobacterium mobile TaxID=28064 RepID=A0A6I3SJT6_HELMO|nr:MBL fold metallo-hydrolase [Heliobacterium mobile]MTV49171.1 MBL fold metallo-hydrolase [Heliobacterium mobile]
MHLRPDPKSWSKENLTLSWLGHATFLMNFFGTRILIDPALENRIGITPLGNSTIGPKRFHPPALTAAELGPVDLLLVSHAHTDHFDYPTLRKVQSPHTIAVTARGTLRLWRRLTFKSVIEMHWRDVQELSGVRIRAIEGNHWGARLPWYKEMEANSFLLSKNGVNIFYGADSAYTPKFKAQLAGTPIDLAIIGIGAYSPKPFEARHATPEQAWQMVEEIGAKYVIPMHFSTFKLSQEPMEEPLQRFLHAASRQLDRVVMREIGATWVMPSSNICEKK